MQEIRCGHCGRKIGEGEVVELRFRCARCKTLNHIQFPATRHTIPARPSASIQSGETHASESTECP